MVIKDINFNVIPFWVQFHGLLLETLNNENARILGDSVGDTVMFERPVIEGKMGRGFIRVRTLIQTDEPLTLGFWVPREHKDPTWVSVKYERLQTFCYTCDRIGHDGRNCKFSTDQASSVKDS